MSKAITFQVDRESVNNVMDAINRASTELNKPLKSSVRWAGALFLGSAAKLTRLSKPKHKVVELKNVKGRRRAKFALIKYNKQGQEIKVPLWGTGKGGIRRYETKSEANKSPRRKIGRRGLARKSWKMARQKLGGGEISRIYGVPSLAEISWSGGASNPSVIITNRIRYMDKAMIGGMGGINKALQSSSNKMMKRIEQEIEKKIGAA